MSISVWLETRIWAGNTYLEPASRQAKHFSRAVGADARDVRGFVEGIYNDVRRRLSFDFEHVRQLFGERVIQRLLCSFVVIQMEAREDVMTGIRPQPSAELKEEGRMLGRMEITPVLLLGVPEVEEVGHQS